MYFSTTDDSLDLQKIQHDIDFLRTCYTEMLEEIGGEHDVVRRLEGDLSGDIDPPQNQQGVFASISSCLPLLRKMRRFSCAVSWKTSTVFHEYPACGVKHCAILKVGD